MSGWGTGPWGLMPWGGAPPQQERGLGPVAWLAKITRRDGVVHRFTDEAASSGNFLWDGEEWQPYLLDLGAIKLNRSAEASCEHLELSNVDQTISRLLREQAFEGATCEIWMVELGPDIETKIGIFTLTEQQETRNGVRFRPVSIYDPGSREVPWENYTSEEFPTITPKLAIIVDQTPGAGGGGGGGPADGGLPGKDAAPGEVYV